ncbi:molybdopterin cofactor-binding domain-containing protein [Nocardioides convexus]|uniref:molybdopterin cofactor-binding domain-containing protein n=1 Tax=Nocardioides convexus TaxID=2712224 RepID=UPI00241898C9|nr:molybdopterin cofactor-binding domain-containing protein [Nocardioides convexus]
MEPNCAVADVRAGRATIWGGLKSPIDAQSKVAKALGMPQDRVTVNVVQGGGSFGRKVCSATRPSRRRTRRRPSVCR